MLYKKYIKFTEYHASWENASQISLINRKKPDFHGVMLHIYKSNLSIFYIKTTKNS